MPFEKGYIGVGGGHSLYFERHGNPHGIPVVWLHGGPGGGCSFNEHKYFNLDHYDLLIFDQRGAGKSTPFASTEENSIDLLIDDIEVLRRHFKHKSWHVAGGSWGSALALLYTLKYPKSVDRLLLRGIFFADRKGAYHIIEPDGAAARFQHMKWFQDYRDLIPEAERAQGLMIPYYNRLTKGDRDVAVEAALRFMLWDTAICTLEPCQDFLDKIQADPQASLALSRIYFHYIVHEFDDANRNKILDGFAKLDIPVDIVHGMQDWICPVENAQALHRACRNSNLKILENCGHSMIEPAMQQAFRLISDRWAEEWNRDHCNENENDENGRKDLKGALPS